MMESAKRERLSRLMSYLLRHHPEEGELELDQEGMVAIERLVEAIRSRGYEWVKAEHIKEVAELCPKQRFRIVGDRIGARYGHSARLGSIDPGPAVRPPDLLYHGTPRRWVSSILSKGLKPRQRQFVHLSKSPADAVEVGRRRDPKPAILVINAARAHADGIPFYKATDSVYLAPYIPSAYISVQ